ncbi:MAG TPA: dihydrolipoamide acetyltransferase family protein [Gemmatimonadaceae bacterium]|nr:dihydrolipoamide acetyltransferase family protein [Gemmatimonadaceae bacterium]
MPEFRMPSLGADMDFGRVVEWRAAAGDRITRGAILVEVETDKGTFELESPTDGTVAELLVPAGAKVPVGTVLATLTTNGAQAAPPPPAAPAPRPPETVRASPAARRAAAERGIDLATIHGTGPDGAVTIADVERAAAMHVEPAPRVQRVSPLARKMAEDLRVDLDTVPGTGAEGIITKGDVERAAAARERPTTAAETATMAVVPEEAQAGMRRAIAAAVSRSKREIPHYYLSTDIDLARAVKWLDTENLRRPVAERLLPAVLLLKSVAMALRRFPALNGFWVNGAFQPGSGIHVGVAISLRGGGLVAPAIHDADTRSVDELMRAVADLVQRARTGGLRGSEMTDPTITITSLGDQGVSTVFGVIYPPQVAIVGFGRIMERPWAEHGMLAARPVVTSTLAADHRATDGHYGGLFLAEVGHLLQTPEAL